MLYSTKTLAMQRLADHARINSHFTCGAVHCEKWPSLSAKFARLYGTDDTRFTKHRQRKKKEATCVLIAWQKSPEQIQWWLLCTEGKGRVWENELLRDFQIDQRIEIAGGYELVHDGTSWSWKYKERHIQSLRESIHRAIASKDGERLQQLVNDIFLTAGFRLARRQAGHLIAFVRAEWKRLRREPIGVVFPAQMLYARRLSDPK